MSKPLKNLRFKLAIWLLPKGEVTAISTMMMEEVKHKHCPHCGKNIIKYLDDREK